MPRSAVQGRPAQPENPFETRPMTPAVNIAKKTKIDFRLHEYDHDPSAASYGEEAAVKLGVDGDRLFKTLVVAVDGRRLCIAVLPVSHQLDLKAFASAVDAKRAAMADRKDASRATGYVLGGVSPLGQKQRLPTVIDASAQDFDTIFVSAGRRGLQIELAPQDLRSLTNAGFARIGK